MNTIPAVLIKDTRCGRVEIMGLLKEFIKQLEYIEAKHPGVEVVFDYAEYSPVHNDEIVSTLFLTKTHVEEVENEPLCIIELTNRTPA